MGCIVSWKNLDVQTLLYKRLESAKKAKESIEKRWIENEAVLYGQISGLEPYSGYLNQPMEGDTDPGGGLEGISTHFNFRYYRFIHSQLASNPPVVTAEPVTGDAEDKRKASIANQCIEYSRRKYHIKDEKSLVAAETLALGSGVMKVIYNSELGEILEVEDNGEVVLEGDIEVSQVSAYDLFPDPVPSRARKWRYIFERVNMSLEDAIDFFGEDKKSELHAAVVSQESRGPIGVAGESAFAKPFGAESAVSSKTS